MFAGLSRKPDGLATGTTNLPMADARSEMPPFWELEELIVQGHSMTDALTIMARRQAHQAFPVVLSGPARPSRQFAGRVRLSA